METFDNTTVDTPIALNEPMGFDDAEDFETVGSTQGAEVEKIEKEMKKEEKEAKKDAKNDKKETKEAEEAKEEAVFDEERGTRDTDKRDNKGKDDKKDDGKEESKDKDDGDAKKEDEKDEQDAKQGKPRKIKIKNGDEVLKLDPESEITLKIDGKKVNLPLQEVINNASSVGNVKQKLEEISIKSNEISQKEAQVNEKHENLTTHLAEIIGKIQDKDGDPNDAMYYLLELAGENIYNYEQRVFNRYYDEFEKIYEMDEVERKLYMTEKENSWLKKSTERKAQLEQARNEQNRYEQRASELKKQYGVTDSQYSAAEKDLLRHYEQNGLDVKEIRPEHKIDLSLKTRAVDKAESLIQQVNPDSIDDSELVTTLATFIYEEPSVDDKVLLEHLREELLSDNEDDEDEEIIKQKVKDIPKRNVQESKSEGHFETFDDFD